MQDAQAWDTLAIEWGESSNYQITTQDLQEAATNDDFYQQVLLDTNLQDQLGLCKVNGMLITRQNQVWIPEDDSLRFKLILEHHDQPFYGHWALNKTLQLVQSYYYWPTMKRDVEHVVETCDVC